MLPILTLQVIMMWATEKKSSEKQNHWRKNQAEQLGYAVLIAEGSPIVMSLIESSFLIFSASPYDFYSISSA